MIKRSLFTNVRILSMRARSAQSTRTSRQGSTTSPGCWRPRWVLELADGTDGVPQGLYEQAKPLYERSLEIRKKALGEDHPAVATALNNLAELLRAQVGC
mmetsp:Transcript_4240/g.13992  ORF Transcript_4240/g.13992 Transcript_4240/m.13992 type:complete len:100 (+) Transcript_4240:38-337(+)